MRGGRALPALRWLAIAGLALMTLVYIATAHGLDAYQWWTANLASLYTHSSPTGWSYVYSPAFAELIQPLRLLPWPVFLALVLTTSVCACVYLIGPWPTLLFMVAQLPAMDLELRNANINLLMAAAIWWGLRYPALWAFPLLTKVTPGIGILWFAVRREWRSLAIAAGATATIVAVSFAFQPGLWADWAAFLAAGAPDTRLLPWPIRAGLAALLIVWGARTDRAWTVPIAAVLAHTSLAWPLAFGALGYWLGRLPDPVQQHAGQRPIEAAEQALVEPR